MEASPKRPESNPSKFENPDNANLARQLAEMELEIVTLKAKLENAERQISTDGLTGLLNYYGYKITSEILFEKFKQNKEGATSLSVVAFDLDGFKKINDTLGHEAGDDYLKTVSESVRSVVREHDILARKGGDEFVLVLEGDVSEANNLAERIRTAVITASNEVREKYSNKFTDISEGHVTASIGVSSSNEGVFATVEELYHAADLHSYFAKALGRNTVVDKTTATEIAGDLNSNQLKELLRASSGSKGAR